MIMSKNARGICPFKDARSNLPICVQPRSSHTCSNTDWSLKTGVTIRRVQLVSGNPQFSHNLKRFRGDLGREPASTARVTGARTPSDCGAPSSWSNDITKSQENYKLPRKLFCMRQQPWIKWHSDVNRSLIWGYFDVHVNITPQLFASAMN